MNKVIDAYRYFFPVGWGLGVWGVFLWILFPLGWVQYPGQTHPDLMLGGFFLSFVCGFLMTAAPKFTSSFEPTMAEQRTAFALIALLISAVVFFSKVYFYFTVVLLFLFLMIFLVRRFLKRRSNPPDAFLFVGVGVLAGLTGSVGLLLGYTTNLPSFLFQLSRLFFLQAYIFCLVLGVGSRLIPALLGWVESPQEGSPQKRVFLFTFLAFAFIGSYILEAAQVGIWAQALRVLVIGYIAFKFWRIHKFPARRGVQTWWLWASAWSLLLGQAAMIFFPDYRIHILHVILVSGLALMTFMIATRVSLAHGKHDLGLEKNSKVLFVGALLVSLAGFTRLSAGFAPHIYQSHLIYASYTWIIGLVVWAFVFIPKMISVRGEPTKES